MRLSSSNCNRARPSLTQPGQSSGGGTASGRLCLAAVHLSSKRGRPGGTRRLRDKQTDGHTHMSYGGG